MKDKNTAQKIIVKNSEICKHFVRGTVIYLNHRNTEVVKMANAADKMAVMTENLRDMGLDDESVANPSE